MLCCVVTFGVIMTCCMFGDVCGVVCVVLLSVVCVVLSCVLCGGSRVISVFLCACVNTHTSGFQLCSYLTRRKMGC